MGFLLLLGILATAAAGKAVLFDTICPDAFSHLRVAAQLQSDGVGPLVDRLSFASRPRAWSPYSWLAELGMKSLWDRGGYRGALAAQAALQAIFILTVALGCRAARRADEPRSRYIPSPRAAKGEMPPPPCYLSAALATTLAGALSLPYLGFRPSTGALLILAVCAWLLVRDRACRERSRAVWLAIPLTALAINLHPYALAMPAWVLALLIGAAWERLFVALPPERPEAERRVSRYLLLLIATSAACLATPMLPGIIEALLRFSTADPMLRFAIGAEPRAHFHGPVARLTISAGVLAALILLLNRRRLRAGELVWLLFGGVLVMRLDRFTPLLAMSAGPMLAVVLPRLGDRPLAFPLVRVGLAGCLAFAVTRVALGFPAPGRPFDQWVNRRGPATAGYPTAAADFVAANVRPTSGRLISEIAWGGYLEWRLGDRYQLLLDGRTHLFTPEFWKATYLSDPDRRRAFLEQVNADAAVLPAGRSVFRASLAHLGWTSVYRDDRAEVMVPPATPEREARRLEMVSAGGTE